MKNKYTPEQVQTLNTFNERWDRANRQANVGSYYQNYQISNSQLYTLVEDFTLEQKEFIQSTLDDARCNIGYASVFK